MLLRRPLEAGIDGWKSRYASVDAVSRHLQRKSGGCGAPSHASVVLNSFCKYVGKDPDQLVSLAKDELKDLIHSYLDQGLAKGLQDDGEEQEYLPPNALQEERIMWREGARDRELSSRRANRLLTVSEFAASMYTLCIRR